MAVIKDNLNARSFAGMYVTGGAATQNTDGTPGVYVKLTQFTVNGAHSDLLIPDHANDRIMTYKSGVFQVKYTMTFDAGSSDIFYFQVFSGPVGSVAAEGNTVSATKVQAPSDWCNCSSFGFIVLDTYDVVELHVACSGATKAVAIKYANLALLRVSTV